MDENPNKRRGPIGWLVEQLRSHRPGQRGRRSVVLWPGHLLFLVPMIVGICVVFGLTLLAIVREVILQLREWFP